MVHDISVDEEVPQDIKAYFGHPLNSSVNQDNGALALLHEYHSLPAIEKSDSDDSAEGNSPSMQQRDRSAWPIILVYLS